MVLDGHDGSRAVKFALTHIPHLLLQSELMGGDRQVLDALKRAIVNTEREFFIGVDPYITRKVTLQFEIEVSSNHEKDLQVFNGLFVFPCVLAKSSRC